MVLTQILFICKLRGANASQFNLVEHLLWATAFALTEHTRQPHVAAWAHELELARTADWALGANCLAVNLARLGAHATAVLAHLAHRLGADGRRNARVRIGQTTLSPPWTLHELGLGVVHEATLGRSRGVLAVSSHADDAALGVQELGWVQGDGCTTARHFLGTITLENNQHFQRFEHVLQVT